MAKRPVLRLFRSFLIGLFVLLFSLPIIQAQGSSVLNQGKWVKMSFTDQGIYKIDRAQLADMGFDPLEIDPRNIAVYGNRGGMLPQSNQTERTSDLHENSIMVVGEDDGIFNSEDYIVFYVDRVHPVTFDQSNNQFSAEKNLYSDTNHYFITVKTTLGKRVVQKPNLGTSFPIIDSYNKIIYQENELYNILGSGRRWFGERFDSQNTQTFNLDFEDLKSDAQININLSAIAQSLISSSMTVELGNNLIGQLDFNAIPNARYTVKGNEQNGSFEASTTNLTGSPTLKLTFNRNGSTAALAYLDNFLLDIPTHLNLRNGQTVFRSTDALDNSISTFQIGNSSTEALVWDISDPLDPMEQSSDFANGNNVFGDFSDVLKAYIIFNPTELSRVPSYEPLENQDLQGMDSPEFLILTHENFMGQAVRLAEFRQSNDGLDTEVVNIDKVYNEFASGRQDITAIRDFIRYLHQKNSRFKYVLLFGKGSYDYKDRLENNTNYMPTYEARASLDPLGSYSSDDFFGFLDADEGEWIEASFGDHLLDVGIGRIPATTEAEARIAVDKIINYQTSPSAFGDWRSRILFVADDGDNNIHQRDADQLATLVDTSFSHFNVQKLYLDAYEQETLPNGEVSPDAQNALLNAIDQGVLILNFTGHGAETGWMQERVLTLETIDELSNENTLPLLVTATCEFGRNDDPAIVSGAEKIIFKENSGAIGLITTARPVFSSTNYDLNLALYGSILQDQNGQYARLGDVIQFTKNNSLNGSSNRNFILLGDPSMRLAYPDQEISIQAINGVNVSPDEPDTIRALQRIQITGQIEQLGQKDLSFNGVLKLTLLDKTLTSQTLGTESQVFEYEERNSKLFSGSSTIQNGEFTVEFVVPRNIDYDWGRGKISMYATDIEGTRDAFGSSKDFIIGGTFQDPNEDNTPPVLTAYMNDTLSAQPFYVKPDANLLIKISDENGINISESGVGQEISAVLNDSVQYNLNSYFTTIRDDFTTGWVNFPMRNLPVGVNKLLIKAWDNYNNSHISTLEFIVNDETSTLITDLSNFPNPFIDNTTFSIAHNSAGERIELVVEIYNSLGDRIISFQNEIPSGKSIEQITWDGTNGGGSKLENGIYIYNVILKSLDSGNAYSRRQKLIISN